MDSFIVTALAFYALAMCLIVGGCLYGVKKLGGPRQIIVDAGKKIKSIAKEIEESK